MRSLPPLNHPLFPSFVRAFFEVVTPNSNVPNFEGDFVDTVVAAAAAAASARVRELPLTDWDSHPPAAAGGWLGFWQRLFVDVAAETSRPLCGSDSVLRCNTNALFALCVLCAYDPMAAWLDITQQQQQQLDHRRLTNHAVGVTCAAVRVTRSLYNASKVRATEHLDGGSRSRAGSGGTQRVVAASAAPDANCVCLHWNDQGSHTDCSAFAQPLAAAVCVGDAVAFDAMIDALAPALVRAWWDIIAPAYGATPLLAGHLARYMQHCRSSNGLCVAVQHATRCLPTAPLIACMHNLITRHNAPCSELWYVPTPHHHSVLPQAVQGACTSSSVIFLIHMQASRRSHRARVG